MGKGSDQSRSQSPACIYARTKWLSLSPLHMTRAMCLIGSLSADGVGLKNFEVPSSGGKSVIARKAATDLADTKRRQLIESKWLC